MSSTRRRVDWSFGPGHGPVSGVLNAAAAALGITMWAWLFDTSAWWALLIGGALAVLAPGVAMWYDQPSKVVVFRAVCWGLAALWSVWVLARWPGWYLFGKWHIMTFWRSPSSPWTWRGLLPLLAGTAIIVFVAWRIDVAEKREEADRKRLEAERAARAAEAEEAARFEREPLDEAEAIGDRWEPHLEKITRHAIKILNVEVWPVGGFTLDTQLPADGTVLSDIKIYEEALAASAPENPETMPDGSIVYQGLPDGCGVEIQPNPGMGRRNILFKVTTSSALGDDIPYPLETMTMDNIENPRALGVETDRGVAKIPMRFETTVMVGNTDSGKSNETNVITTELGRCTNVVLVGIDLTGNGRFMRPFLHAYREGACENPMFRNVAFTPKRARALCQSLLQIIDGRTADYAPLMRAQNVDVVPVSPAVPLIYLIVDEFKRLPSDVQDMVADIVETGRGAGVRVVACSLEATREGLPKAVLKHARNRIGLRVVDETELIYLFDSTWKRARFDPASLPWKGSGLYANGPATPKKFKGYRIDPALVREISIRCSPWRPEIDDPSVARGNTVTVTEPSDMGPVEVVYEGIWTDWEADCFPAMFAEGADDDDHTTSTTSTGAAGAAANGGGTATLLKRGLNVPIIQTDDPAGLAAQGMRELGDSVTHMDNALEALRRQADGEDPIDMGQGPDGAGDGTGDDGQGEGGEGEDPAPRAAGGSAGLRTPTADEIAAMFHGPTVDEPVRPPGPWSTPPGSTSSSPPPPAAPVDPIAAAITPPGQGNAGPGSPPPRRRVLQLLYLAGAAGCGPTELHGTLAREGYPTSLTTVQGWLKEWLMRRVVDQPDGPRTPYFRGSEFPTDKL